ncbi:fibronectin type III domain-containing protein, partial [Desulfosarcina sp.]|nr:fibronectin type III domain-containing protein [Desulfosarcina sp.]
NLDIIEPSALNALVISEEEVVLTWNDNNSDETGFTLERKLASETNFTEIQTLPANTTTFTDNVNGEYDYRIKTYNTSFISIYSNVSNVLAIVRPDAPTELVVAGSNSISLTIEWNNPQGTINGAEVTVINNENGDVSSKVFQGEDNSQTINNLEENTEYTCIVKVFNEGGFSEYSEELIAQTDDVKPIKPSLKPVETISDTELKLKWIDRSDNEDGFLIRRKKEGGLYTVIDSVETDVETYLDEGLEPETTYSYKIKSYNEAGNSESSIEKSGTTGSTGIFNNSNDNNNLISVFPNPASDIIQISSQFEMNTILLYDYSGQLLFQKAIKDSKYSLILSDFKPGLYVLKVESEKGFYSEKIVVE